MVVELGRQSGPAAAAFKVVASPLVALHVAANAKGLAAPGVRALEGLLARVRVAVDPERAGPRERLVACLADVAVLGLGKRRRRRRGDVVVVLPRVGAGAGAKGHRHWHGREGLGCGQPLARSTRAQERTYLREGALVVHPLHLLRWGSRLHGRVVRGHRGLAHVRWGSKLRLVGRCVDGLDLLDPGHRHVTLVQVAERRCRLKVVVGCRRELAHGSCRWRVVPLKRRIRRHGRAWWERIPHQSGIPIVRRVGSGLGLC